MQQNQTARVSAVHKERFELLLDGQRIFGKLKSAVYYYNALVDFPTVGDEVEIAFNPFGDSQIIATLPRRTCIERANPDPAAKGRGQAIAANVDTVFILSSLNQDFNVKRLQRYLSVVRQSGATPVVLLTKLDLCADPEPFILEAQKTAGDSAVYAVSARTGDGLVQLQRYLAPGQTAVFLGSSGVGKSSLVNALLGKELMDVGGIREDDDKGRHTTTYRQLLTMDNGAVIIDTPGMRELGMWTADEGVQETFADVAALTGQCRFRDCRHDKEPGCAVQQALRAGALSPKRWEQYRLLKSEAAGAAHAARVSAEKKQQKALSKQYRNYVKGRGER